MAAREDMTYRVSSDGWIEVLPMNQVLAYGMSPVHVACLLYTSTWMSNWQYANLTPFKQKTAYEMESRDWSSDVCSSDLFINAMTNTYHSDIVNNDIAKTTLSNNNETNWTWSNRCV